MRSTVTSVAVLTLGLAVLVGLNTVYALAAPHNVSRTPVQAVRTVVRPYYVQGYNFANCTTKSPRQFPSLTCPETPRLRHKLAMPRGHFSGLPFCRCQGAARTVRVWQIDNNGRVAHVNAYWNLGPNSFTDTFVVRRTPAGWLVDDEYCAGLPATTIYGKSGGSPCR